MEKLPILVVFLFLFACTGKNAEVYQWRGDLRDGSYPDTGLMESWPAEGPELLWSVEGVGNGYGSPIITRDRIFVNGEVDSTGYVKAYDLDGKLLWESSYGPEYTISFQGSRSTPTYYDGKLFVCSGEGRITCFDARDGKEEWHTEMMGDLHGRMNRFGYAQSLLVDDGSVYCQPGGPDTNMVALDRHDGSLKWFNSGAGEISAYCSPVIIGHNGNRILLTFSEHSLLAFNPDMGELLWCVEQDTFCDIHGNTPLYTDGYIYTTSGCGNMTEKLELSEDGRSVKQVWRNRNLDNYMGGVRTKDGYLIGSGARKKFLKRVSMEDGTCTDSLATGNGNIIEADGRFYFYSDRGDLHLVVMQPDSLIDVSSFRVRNGTKEHFSHPVIAHGNLYLRHGDALMAYNLKKP